MAEQWGRTIGEILQFIVAMRQLAEQRRRWQEENALRQLQLQQQLMLQQQQMELNRELMELRKQQAEWQRQLQERQAQLKEQQTQWEMEQARQALERQKQLATLRATAPKIYGEVERGLKAIEELKKLGEEEQKLFNVSPSTHEQKIKSGLQILQQAQSPEEYEEARKLIQEAASNAEYDLQTVKMLQKFWKKRSRQEVWGRITRPFKTIFEAFSEPSPEPLRRVKQIRSIPNQTQFIEERMRSISPGL